MRGASLATHIYGKMELLDTSVSWRNERDERDLSLLDTIKGRKERPHRT